jgi:hypothetical protein
MAAHAARCVTRNRDPHPDRVVFGRHDGYLLSCADLPGTRGNHQSAASKYSTNTRPLLRRVVVAGRRTNDAFGVFVISGAFSGGREAGMGITCICEM